MTTLGILLYNTTKMTLKQVTIITRHTKGGSWKWGGELARQINQSGAFQTEHVDNLNGIFKSHFFIRGDIVHSAYPLWPKFWARPLILTIHGNFRKEGWRQKFFYPRAIKSADIVTVPSEFLKNELNIERARVIPNAVNVNEFNQVLLRQNLDNPKILTVMNFNFWHKAKGIIEIAKILNKLSRETRRRTEYTIVGDGSKRQKVEKTVKSFESEFLKINFAGFNDPKKYFLKADIFAYCSGFDNMPIAVIEAMAAGLPVISNKVGAIPEIITNGVDGFISSDPADYQYNLNHMLEDSDLRQKLGQAARQKVKEEFDWSVILPRWISIYSELLK